MRYLLALMLLWTTASYADHNGIQPHQLYLPIICGDTDHMLEAIEDQFNEEIVMMAPSANRKGESLFHSLWINTQTKTWTFIVMNKKTRTTCVLASGDNFDMVFQGTGI